MDSSLIQWILVGVIVALAAGSIIRKLIRKVKHPSQCACGSDTCSCDTKKSAGGCADCPMSQTCGQVKK